MALFSDTDRNRLEDNLKVEKVSATNVSYTPKFKAHALKCQSQRATHRSIFMEAGIDLSLFGEDYPKKCLQRWKKISDQYGREGLKKERRGSGATGRPKGKKFKSEAEEQAYLRVENDFLKKLRALDEKYAKPKGSRWSPRQLHLKNINYQFKNLACRRK